LRAIGLIAAMLTLLAARAGASESEIWRGVTPGEAVIGRNTTFSLDVSGLLTGERVGLYTCQFRTSIVDPLRGVHEERSSPVTVFSPGAAQCDAPAWDLPAVDAVLELYKGDSMLAKQGWPALVTFKPLVLSVAPQAGTAGGGETLTVSGRGFYEDAEEEYTCIWTDGGGASVASAACVVTPGSTRELLCTTPAWPYPAAATQVAVRLGAAAILSDGGARAMAFNYTPSCSSFSAAVADATSHTNVSMGGHGFRSDEPASCHFIPGGGVGGVVSPAVVHGPNAISCLTPLWPEAGCVSAPDCQHNASLRIFLGETLVCAPPPEAFAFLSVWSGVAPTQGLASGGYALTVRGGGFDVASEAKP